MGSFVTLRPEWCDTETHRRNAAKASPDVLHLAIYRAAYWRADIQSSTFYAAMIKSWSFSIPADCEAPLPHNPGVFDFIGDSNSIFRVYACNDAPACGTKIIQVQTLPWQYL